MEKDIIFTKANELYEHFERDYSSFFCSKQRAILYCQKMTNISSSQQDKIFWIDVKHLIKKQF
jgi:hypothetical protein